MLHRELYRACKMSFHPVFWSTCARGGSITRQMSSLFNANCSFASCESTECSAVSCDVLTSPCAKCPDCPDYAKTCESACSAACKFQQITEQELTRIYQNALKALSDDNVYWWAKLDINGLRTMVICRYIALVTILLLIFIVVLNSCKDDIIREIKNRRV
jgi:hypothetical protein